MQNGNLPTSSDFDQSLSSPSGSAAGGTPNSEASAHLDLSSIVATLWREKGLIFLVALVVTGFVFGYTYTRTPIYEASSIVKVTQKNEAPVTGIVGEETVRQQRDLASEVGVLRNSVELASQVGGELQSMDDAVGKSPFPTLVDLETGQSGSRQQVAQRLLQKVEFEPRPERNIIQIIVESERAEEASTIANIYAEKYKKFSLEKARKNVHAAREFLEARAQEQRAKIRKLEQKWESFATANEVVELGEGGERLTAKYNDLKAQRAQLAFQLERERTQLELLRQRLEEMQSRLEGNLIEQQEASGLRSEIQALEETIAENRASAATYYAANPELKGDTARIENEFPDLAILLDRTEALEVQKRKLTRKLAERAAGDQEASGSPLERLTQLRSQTAEKELLIRQLESQVATLDSQIVEYDAKLSELPGQRLQRDQIQQNLEQARAFQETIRNELQKTRIAEESKLGYVDVVKKAYVPSVPVRPKTTQNMILGLLLGLGFGVGVAFLKEATNTRLRRPEDIEEKGYPLLGIIPEMTSEIDRTFDGRTFVEVDERRMSTCLMPLLNPWSSVTENYRLIQTNLKNNTEGLPRTLLVTSAQQREGKTVTSVNMALTAALSGRHVLLIDADMRDPSAHTMLGLSRTPGLANILVEMSGSTGPVLEKEEAASRNDTESMKKSYTYWANRTSVENLHFIPAGITETAPTNLLDSERMQRLVDASQQHYDIVIIDTPPTRAASDAVVIGTQTNASAVVVSADGTDSRALDSVMKSLHTADVQVSGVIFNRFDEKKAGQNGTFRYPYHTREEYDEYQNQVRGVYEKA